MNAILPPARYGMNPISITSKSHAIISGGAGFIGSHLSRRLLESGWRVTILTRHIHAPGAACLAQAGATVIECDLSSPDRMPGAECLERADVFYHLAADVSVGGPTLRETNVGGTQRAAALAAALNVPYLVFASSIEAQGPGADAEIPLLEVGACRPVSDYGASKAEAEQVISQWAGASGREASILRIGNIYGPGSPWLLQPSLMALLGLSPLSHVWPQLRHRLFQPLYIDDLIDGMVSAVTKRLTGLYNITGEEPVTVEEYLRILAGLLQMSDRLSLVDTSSTAGGGPVANIEPDFAYLLMGEPNRCHRSYDNAKLRRAVGPYARWSLTRGLASTITWFQRTGRWPILLRMAQARRDNLCASL
ncbi:MAG TPA: NAD(P)-dependent oxidoreductase [Nitrospira sp.]|nr:NAD(P)-dependent oxidoreductase [Nitrospira sp.]